MSSLLATERGLCASTRGEVSASALTSDYPSEGESMDLSEFPTCLMVSPDKDTMRTGWTTRHNRAVQAFVKEGVGAMSNLTRDERAILSLAAGIRQFIGSRGIVADSSDYYACDIVRTLASAFNDALNYDLGRLDGGTLSEWVCATVLAATGEQL